MSRAGGGLWPQTVTLSLELLMNMKTGLIAITGMTKGWAGLTFIHPLPELTMSINHHRVFTKVLVF